MNCLVCGCFLTRRPNSHWIDQAPPRGDYIGKWIHHCTHCGSLQDLDGEIDHPHVVVPLVGQHGRR